LGYLKIFWKSLLWAFILIVLSVINTGSLPDPDITYFDKMVHFGIYMLFTIILIFDLRNRSFMRGSKKYLFILSFTLASLFGGGMELLQMIPELHRSAEFFDFLANMAGSGMAVILFPYIDIIIGKALKVFE